MKKHSDEAEDKKLIKKELSKKSPKKKIVKHLKKDIKEASEGMKRDYGLIKSMKK
jgi:hypothetical protein